jgi:hypothetical protein
MKKFLDRITPSFIHRINLYLLKNDILGWQLQLPLILWLWFLISLITLPVPFLFNIDISAEDDKVGAGMIGGCLGILQFFLFSALLLQFNASKTFGKKTFANGLKEQLSYLIIMALCLVNVVFWPLIIDYRKSDYMTDQQIRNEAIVYNKARHYFMDSWDRYEYFPNDSFFKFYMEIKAYNENGVRTTRLTKEIYYAEVVKPALAPFFTHDQDTAMRQIDPMYNRAKKGPLLYCIDTEFLNENFYLNVQERWLFDTVPSFKSYQYQLEKKTDQVRLKEIKEFIVLYNKYDKDYYKNFKFDSPEIVLQKYKDNQFIRCIKDIHPSLNDEGEEVESIMLDSYPINRVHRNIIEAKYEKWEETGIRAMVCFFIVLGFSLLMFIFKNVRLRAFILTFVYTGLLALFIGIISALSHLDFIAVHTPFILFFTGIFFVLTINRWPHYSLIKTIFAIVSNFCFAFAPIVLFIYFHEYLDFWKIDYSICEHNQALCREHRELMGLIQLACLWGGIAFYLLFGSLFYKRFYEKALALPLHK